MFKVGDKVRLANPSSKNGKYILTDYGYNITKDTICTIKDVARYSNYECSIVWDGYNHGNSQVWVNLCELELINSNNKKTIMENIKSIYKNLVRKEPEKSFVKAGVMDENENLTPDGKELFFDFLFDENKAEFLDLVVKPILEAQEKEKQG